MSQFDMIVEAIIIIPESKRPVPLHPDILPVTEPFKFRSRLDKVLHFHLFKFLILKITACNNLISEAFPVWAMPKGIFILPTSAHSGS
jgi:hypothetical protein